METNKESRGGVLTRSKARSPEFQIQIVHVEVAEQPLEEDAASSLQTAESSLHPVESETEESANDAAIVREVPSPAHAIEEHPESVPPCSCGSCDEATQQCDCEACGGGSETASDSEGTFDPDRNPLSYQGTVYGSDEEREDPTDGLPEYDELTSPYDMPAGYYEADEPVDEMPDGYDEMNGYESDEPEDEEHDGYDEMEDWYSEVCNYGPIIAFPLKRPAGDSSGAPSAKRKPVDCDNMIEVAFMNSYTWLARLPQAAKAPLSLKIINMSGALDTHWQTEMQVNKQYTFSNKGSQACGVVFDGGAAKKSFYLVGTCFQFLKIRFCQWYTIYIDKEGLPSKECDYFYEKRGRSHCDTMFWEDLPTRETIQKNSHIWFDEPVRF